MNKKSKLVWLTRATSGVCRTRKCRGVLATERASSEGGGDKGEGSMTDSKSEGVLAGIATESSVDWSEFEKEPLRSVDLKELKEQRSVEDVEKLAHLLIKYKHILSDGSLDFRSNPGVKHNTTATIKTTIDNPKIVARGQRCSPDEVKA